MRASREPTRGPANTSGTAVVQDVLPSAGDRAAIEAKISSDMPLPTPRSVTLLAQPHDYGGAAVITIDDREVPDRGVRDDRQRALAEQLAAVGQRDDAGGLQHRQRDGQVAGVLGQLV
jgi:hypothetical protein